MATYKWISGPLDDPNSYSPEFGAPPLNGNLPTTTDTVEFPDGELKGNLSIGGADFLGNTVLSGTIYAEQGVSVEAGSSLNITDGTLTAGSEYFNSASGNSTQTGGTNTVLSTFQINSGSYELDAGKLNAQINELIGVGQSASFLQKGGTHTVTGELTVGYNGIGSYTLTGGVDSILKAGGEFIGYGSSSTFVQSGGTNSSDYLFLGGSSAGNLGTGNYTLSGTGNLTVNEIVLGIFTGGHGDFEQSGGTLTDTGVLTVGEDGGTGTFVQSGGSNTISNHLFLGGSSAGNLGTGNYTLSGTGNLAVNGIFLGIDPGGHGDFEQSGGTLTDTGVLTVGDAGGIGIFELTANSPQATVTGLTTVNSGSLTSVSGGALTLENGLSVLGNGEFYIVTGGKVTIDGNFNVNETPGPSAIYIDGADSSLVMNSSATAPGDLILTGTLLVSQGAIASGIGNADVTSLNVNSLASIEVGDSPLFGIVNPGTSVSHFSAGNMTLGSADLFVGQNGYAHIGVTLTLNATVVTNADGSQIGGVVVFGGGSLEIGGPGTAAPDTVTIGSTGSLLGHGAVLAATIVNDGVVAAQNGLLFLGGNVTGIGVVNIGDNSTLEIGGSFTGTGTVKFTVDGTDPLSETGTGTLILDQPYDPNAPQTFNGSMISGIISNIAVGDQIELNNVIVEPGHAQTIYTKNGMLLLDVQGTDASGKTVHLDYEISSQGNLNIDHFNVTQNGANATLELAQHGTTTTYWLDSSGKAYKELVWGDTLGPNTTVYIQNNGSVDQYVDQWNGIKAANFSGYDLSDYQVHSKEIINNGTDHNPTSTVILASLSQQNLLNVQNPSDFNPLDTHNAAIAYRYSDSDVGKNTQGAPNGAAATMGDLVTGVTGAFAQASGAQYNPTIVGGQLVALSTTSSDGLFNTHSTFANGVLTDYKFTNPDGSSTEWKLDAGKYDYFINGETIPTSTVSGQSLATSLKNINDVFFPGLPLAAISNAVLVVNPGASVFDNSGNATVANNGGINSLDAKGAPTGGAGNAAATDLKINASLVGNDGSSLVGNDGSSLVGNDGSSLVGNDGSSLVGNDGSSLVGNDGSSLVGNDGSSLVGNDGSSLVGNDGSSIASPGGYLANALVFADANGDGVLDDGEVWAYTDANGHFILNGGSGPLVLTGGTDSSTGLPFTATLSAPLRSSDISALTTLANDLAQRTGNIDGSITQIQTALGLSGQIDVTTMDAVAGTQNGDSTSAAVYVDMAKVMDTVELISAAFAGIGASGSAAGNDAFSSMVDMIVNNGSLNVSNKATDVALINAVASTLGINASAIADSVATHIAASNQLLDQYLVADGSGPKLVTNIVTVETSVQAGLPAPTVSSLTAATDNHTAVVNAGHVVTVTMTTSEAVTVTGTPTLQLNDNEVAAYTFGSGTNTLSFSYVAQTGDNVADLHVTGLNLPTGASILDGSGGSLAGSVTSDLGIQVDTVTVPLTSVQQQVLGLYGVLYTRAADFGGLSYWTGVVGQQPDGAGVTVANGASTAITINDATVLGQLFVSTESSYFNQVYGSMSDSAFITTLYGTIGGNTIGIAPGITYWSGVLQALETAGQSQQAARAGIVGEIVQAMIDYNINIRPAGYTDAEWLAAQQRQETTDNKVAVSLAYSNASQQPGGNILDAVTVTDAAFLAATRVIEGVTYNGTTADAAISHILYAVALQDLTQIQPVGVVNGGLMG